MTNSADPDETAPIGAVSSGSTLFASILKFISNVRQLFLADDFSRRHISDAFYLGALRCKHENTHLVFIDMQLYNDMLYFVAGFLGGAFLTVIMYLLLIYQLDWSPYRSFCFSSFVGFLLSMFLAFSVNVRCFVLLMIPQLFSGKSVKSSFDQNLKTTPFCSAICISGPEKGVNNLEIKVLC